MTRLDVVLGDWSDDGHGKSEKYPILVNMPTKDIQDAYKASCEKLGISFNDNEDFTNTKRNYNEAEKYRICCEYDDSSISETVIEILKKHNCPLVDEIIGDDQDEDEEQNYYIEGKDMFVKLLMWFIQQSLPELEWIKVKEKNTIPVLNGYWDKNLNVQFAYGMFS